MNTAEPDDQVRFCPGDVFQARLEERAAYGADFVLIRSPVGFVQVEQVVCSDGLDTEHEQRVDAEPREADNTGRRRLQRDDLA